MSAVLSPIVYVRSITSGCLASGIFRIFLGEGPAIIGSCCRSRRYFASQIPSMTVVNACF